MWEFRRRLVLLILGLIGCLIVTAAFSETGAETEVSTLSGQIFGISPLAIFILLTFGVGIVVGLWALDRAQLYRISLTLCVFAGLVFQLLPTIKGYFLFGNGDPSNHLGAILTIFNTGRLPILDQYPALHIVGAVLGEFTSISLLTLAPLLQEVFYVTFLLSSFALIPSLFKTIRERRVSYMMMSAFPLGYYLLPQFFALSLVPLIILLFKANNRNALFVYSLLLIGLGITHPLVALMLVAAFTLWTFIDGKRIFDSRITFGVIVVLLVFGYNGILTYGVVNVVRQLGIGITNESNVPVAISKLGWLNSFEILVKQAGLASLLAFVEIFLVIKTRNHGHGNILIYFSLLAFLQIPATIFVTSFAVGYLRYFWFIEFCSFLISGLVASYMKAYWARMSIVIFLILVFISTIITTYPSAYNFYENYQMSRNNYVSNAWLDRHISNGVEIGGPLYEPFNQWNLLEGLPNKTVIGEYLFVYPFTLLKVNYHFANETSGPNGAILVTTRLAFETYATLDKGTNTFDPNDFLSLLGNTQFDCVYSSTDEQLFYFS